MCLRPDPFALLVVCSLFHDCFAGLHLREIHGIDRCVVVGSVVDPNDVDCTITLSMVLSTSLVKEGPQFIFFSEPLWGEVLQRVSFIVLPPVTVLFVEERSCNW